MGLAVAGLTTGVIWAFWHLALYGPEGPLFFLQFASWVVPLAIAMGVVVEGARFSVVVAVVMHGAANIAIPILLPDVDRETWLVVTGAVWWIAAAALVRGGADCDPNSEPADSGRRSSALADAVIAP